MKDWGESVSELMSVKKKKKLQGTVHSTVLRGCVYLLYMLYSGDRGSTVVKVLCYKSEGRWFDPSWCH